MSPYVQVAARETLGNLGKYPFPGWCMRRVPGPSQPRSFEKGQLIEWTWVWASSGRWLKPGLLKSMGSQRVGHDWATERQQLTEMEVAAWSIVGFAESQKTLFSGPDIKTIWEMEAWVRKMETSILLLSVYPEQLKAGTRTDIYTTLFIAAKSLQSYLTLCDPIDCSPPGSPVPGILQARTLEWVAISFSNAWKWKVKVKLLSCVRL